MRIENVIKAIMTAKNLKVTEVADRAELAPSVISDARGGRKNTISLTVFEKLCRGLEIKPSDFMRLVELEQNGKTYQELIVICIEEL